MAQPLAKQIKSLERKLKDYSEKELPRASASALNKITGKVKTHLVRTVSKDVKVPTKILNKQVFTSRATTKSLRAYVKSYLRPIAAARLLPFNMLVKNRTRGTNRRGVRVAGQQFDGAFINVGMSSGRGTGKYSKFYILRRLGKERYPLEQITIKIDETVMNNQLPIAQRFMREDFQRELIRQLTYRISKYAK
ncbi:phage tail protein [Cellvibrio mixtus]|uniref:phage tail protein n=1 Tax=Cellvibrio mixtus TaxID=39650 RepID=UPI000587D184|nr:phage tail protein [Cellvibrio mixtus]